MTLASRFMLLPPVVVCAAPLLLSLVASCQAQTQTQVVPALPLPTSTPAAMPTPISPRVSAAPVRPANPPDSGPAPTAPSPIAQLLANRPAAHVAPPRTCPKLPKPPLNVPTPGNGPAVIVNVYDYLSLAPIANVPVKIFHGDVCLGEGRCKPSHPHPDELLKMTGKTDARGQAVFPVPDLDYSSFIPPDPIAGYLPFSADENLGPQMCHPLVHERRTSNGKALVIDKYLIPVSMMAIQTKEDAIDNALQLEELVSWLREHQDAAITVRGGGSSWEVGFGYNNQFNRHVLVNGFTGNAMMLLKRD